MFKKFFFLSIISMITSSIFSEEPRIHTFETRKEEHLKNNDSTSEHIKIYGPNHFDAEICKIVLEAAPIEAKQAIELLKDKEAADDEKPKKILLYGPSGSGKSTLAQVIAQEIGRPCLFIKAGLLGDKYINSTAQNLLKEISAFLGKPCVIVLDEADCILRRTNNQTNPDVDTPKQVWEILDILEQYPNILLIATTNDLTGMLKPLQTRFADDTIEVPYISSDETRKKIIQYFLKDKEHACNDKYINELSKKVADFSIREIEKLAQRARKIVRLRKSSPYLITPADFEAAYEKIKKSREVLANSEEKKSPESEINLQNLSRLAQLGQIAYQIYIQTRK